MPWLGLGSHHPQGGSTGPGWKMPRSVLKKNCTSIIKQKLFIRDLVDNEKVKRGEGEGFTWQFILFVRLPNCLSYNGETQASDVYSLGVLLLQNGLLQHEPQNSRRRHHHVQLHAGLRGRRYRPVQSCVHIFCHLKMVWSISSNSKVQNAGRSKRIYKLVCCYIYF